MCSPAQRIQSLGCRGSPFRQSRIGITRQRSSRGGRPPSILVGSLARSSGRCNDVTIDLSGVAQPRTLRGRPFISAATKRTCSRLTWLRSVPGKHWRSSPFMCSFEGRCHGACGLVSPPSSLRQLVPLTVSLQGLVTPPFERKLGQI